MYMNNFYKRMTRMFYVFRFTQSNLSRYAKDFIDPIVEKEELSKPLDEFDTRRHRPVKAARTEETIMGDQAVQ